MRWEEGRWEMTGGAGWLVMIVFLVLVAVLAALTIVATLRAARRSTWDGNSRAEEALAMRFASGDIDVDEYRRRLAELRANVS